MLTPLLLGSLKIIAYQDPSLWVQTKNWPMMCDRCTNLLKLLVYLPIIKSPALKLGILSKWANCPPFPKSATAPLGL
jgi:hypothetical protein